MTITTEQEVEAVLQDDCVLDGLPEELRTPAVCLAAVRQDGRVLRFVSPALRPEAVCLAALVHGRVALEPMSRRLVMRTVCGAAAERDGLDPDLVWKDVCERRDAMPSQKGEKHEDQE